MIAARNVQGPQATVSPRSCGVEEVLEFEPSRDLQIEVANDSYGRYRHDQRKDGTGYVTGLECLLVHPLDTNGLWFSLGLACFESSLPPHGEAGMDELMPEQKGSWDRYSSRSGQNDSVLDC